MYVIRIWSKPVNNDPTVRSAVHAAANAVGCVIYEGAASMGLNGWRFTAGGLREVARFVNRLAQLSPDSFDVKVSRP